MNIWDQIRDGEEKEGKSPLTMEQLHEMMNAIRGEVAPHDGKFQVGEIVYIIKPYKNFVVGNYGTATEVNGNMVKVNFRCADTIKVEEEVPAEHLYALTKTKLEDGGEIISGLPPGIVPITSGEYKRVKPRPASKYTEDQFREGDVISVMMPVKVRLKWAKDIVDDVDYDGNATSFKEGWVMTVMEPDDIVYSKQQIINFLYSTF